MHQRGERGERMGDGGGAELPKHKTNAPNYAKCGRMTEMALKSWFSGGDAFPIFRFNI